jgi:hypothetical protein
MPHTEHEPDIAIANDTPVRWRRERLVDAGFPLGQASRLARDARYDLHALIELVERGCPPSLAVRILGPDDLEIDAA